MSISKSSPALAFSSELSQGKDQSAFSKVIDSIKMIFQKIADFLVLIWFALQYAVFALSKGNLSTWQEIFGDGVVCKTANFAKFSDLPKYVALRRNPIEVGSTACSKASSLGFSPKTTTLAPLPFKEGHCFGNTTFFLKKWKETRDIYSLIENFDGGTPIQGAIYQEAYEELYEVIYYPKLCEMILNVINCYPLISFAEETQKWNDKGYCSALVILDALQAYLKEGHHPKEGGFTDYIRNWSAAHHHKICGEILASVRRAEQRFVNDDLVEKDLMQAAFANAGLTVVKFHHMESQPGDVLRTLSILDSGLFKLSFPSYSPTGHLDGLHSVGLVVDSENCYIQESNGAIAWIDKQEMTQSVGRLFTYYTGLDYSQDLDGERPSFWRKLENFFNEKANPPSSPLASHFELIELK
jgi:hypothetical protein